MNGEMILLILYAVIGALFMAIYSAHRLHNTLLMAILWPLTAPFIITFLLFFSVKASAKRIMKKITETETENNVTVVATKEDSNIPQKIVYVYVTKPNLTSWNKRRKKATTQTTDEIDSIFDAVFEEENLHKQEEKKDE